MQKCSQNAANKTFVGEKIKEENSLTEKSQKKKKKSVTQNEHILVNGILLVRGYVRLFYPDFFLHRTILSGASPI